MVPALAATNETSSEMLMSYKLNINKEIVGKVNNTIENMLPELNEKLKDLQDGEYIRLGYPIQVFHEIENLCEYKIMEIQIINSIASDSIT